MKQAQSFFWILLVLVAFALSLFWWKNIFLKNDSQGTFSIGGREWEVEYARTPALREKGLGYRESLPKGHGMIFIFSVPGQYSFWMKGMEFPLDFAFIRDNRIVSIERNISSEDTRILSAPEAFDSVLEVNAGELEGVSPGQVVTGVQK